MFAPRALFVAGGRRVCAGTRSQGFCGRDDRRERKTYEAVRDGRVVLGAVPRGPDRHRGGPQHEADCRGGARGCRRHCACPRRGQRQGRSASGEQHHLAERGRSCLARGLSEIQDEEGRALLHREPAQARAEGQSGGLHHTVGGHLQHGVSYPCAARGWRGHRCHGRRYSPRHHRGRRRVPSARRGGGRAHVGGRAVLP